MQFLKKVTVEPNCSVMQAMRLFGAYEGLRILIVNKNHKFYGIVTEQDVRKGLLNGLNLEDNISSIINKNPIVADQNTPKEILLSLANKHNIQEIPLKDGNGNIVEIVSIVSLIQQKKYLNPIVIMAGGLGTRLKPLTDNIPKPMLKIGKKPILQIILERFCKQGFENFILCVNYKSDIIKNYFGDGRNFGCNISYINEKKRLGTAGALSLLDNINELPFFVINGDIITDIDFVKMLQQHDDLKSNATMGVRNFSYQVPYGVISTDKNLDIISITEKPTLDFKINAGVYILNPSVLSMIPKDTFFDMPNLFQTLIDKGIQNVSSYLIEDYWIDIGQIEEYKKASEEIYVS